MRLYSRREKGQSSLERSYSLKDIIVVERSEVLYDGRASNPGNSQARRQIVTVKSLNQIG